MPRRSVHATVGETVWFRRGDGVEFVVVVGTPAHHNLIAEGAVLVGGSSTADVPEPEPAAADVPLADLKRPELDKLAADLGIEDPAKLPNKGAVVEAIEAAQAAGPAADGVEQTLGEE